MGTRLESSSGSTRIGRLLLGAVILASTNNKLTVGAVPGNSGAGPTVYKALFVCLCVFSFVIWTMRRVGRVGTDRRLWRLIVASVVVETGSSMLGGLLMFGKVAAWPEIYWLIQRLNLIVIP